MNSPFSSRYWHHCTSPQFAVARHHNTPPIAIIPVGATEQHGPHLPLCVDSHIATKILELALPQLDDTVLALALPPVAIGCSLEHTSFAGTLSFSPTTFLAVLSDLMASLAKSGVQKVIFFNAHGGNMGLLDVAGRDARMHHHMLVHHVSWFNLPLPTLNGAGDLLSNLGADENRFGAHAGLAETALMLAMNEELVHMNLAQDFSSTAREKAQTFAVLGNGKSSKQAWAIEDYNPHGAAGNAQQATRELGVELLQAAATALSQLITEVHHQPLPAAFTQK